MSQTESLIGNKCAGIGEKGWEAEARAQLIKKYEETGIAISSHSGTLHKVTFRTFLPSGRRFRAILRA